VLFGDVQTAAASQSSASRDERIETPYLQLVMTRLWREEVSAGSHLLRLSTLNALGGAERIVKTHLDAVMEALPETDRSVAAAIFRFLVTPSGTKIAHTARDLADYVALPAGQVSQVLERLAKGDVRILRAIAPPPETGGSNRFQIFHDVLAAAILDWRLRFMHAREVIDAERRLAVDRVVEDLGGQLWSATLWIAIAGVVLTTVVLTGLLTRPESSVNAVWQLTVTLVAGSILILAVRQPHVGVRMWRGTRRALALGFSPAMVLELLSKTRGETVSLMTAGDNPAVVNSPTRRKVRHLRIVTAVAAWLSVTILPVTLLVGLMLGGRGLVTPRGLVAVTLLPTALVLLLALISRLWQAVLVKALRSARPQPTEPTQSTASPSDTRGRMRLVLVAGALWSVTTTAAAILDSSIVLIPLLESGASRGFEGQYSRIVNLSKQVEVGRRYRVPIDPAISPAMAGRALSSMSLAAGDGRPDPLTGELPAPRALPRWLPGDAGPFKLPWRELMSTLISKAPMGFRPEERQYLERITAHPGLDEYRIVAQAADIDWFGARVPIPFPKQMSALMLPIPSFSALTFASDLQIARAALLLSEKRVDEAEGALREVVSVGMALQESARSVIEAHLGARIARTGLDNLEVFYGLIGRDADLVALRDARLSTAAPEAALRGPSGATRPLDTGESRAKLVTDLTNSNQLRGIRWDAVLRASVTPCSNSRELLFGLEEPIRAAVTSAREDLVRSPTDAALFNLLNTRPILPAEGDVGFDVPVIFPVVRSLEPVFGRRGIAQCIFMPVLAIASAP
jgi:hypothetical protein